MGEDNVRRASLVFLIMMLAVFGCGGDDSPTDVDHGGDEPGNLPTIPVPSSPNDLMPARTEDLVIGMSTALDVFEPYVDELEMRQDDGSLIWVTKNQNRVLACEDMLPRNTCDLSAAEPTYISARPHLLHTRHWRRLEQNSLGPGTAFTLTKEVTYGVSTSNTESVEFSRTMGVEVTASGGWGPFSASVSASYEQTNTYSEVRSVTFSEETKESREYMVQAPASGTRVFVLWQLVDEFSYVDADTIPIHESPTLTHVRMPAIAHILFPSDSVVRMVTTDFP
jgi:hypothetical protein